MPSWDEIILVQTDEERKAKQKARDQNPERKAKRKAQQKLRRQTPEFKAKEKERKASPEYKAKSKLRRQTPEYKAKRKEYENRRYGSERKAYHRKLNESLKFEVHSFYSKLHSNSDVPCCRCCGENFVLDFLTIDHINGRKHLPKNEAKLTADALVMFLKRNNFPEGYQVLCFNCNISKGFKINNNKCPMENKPH